ncbi:MAG: glucosamine-6-phosphate deaminase [Propionibacterium sp.]|nr:glucosamine-6-phosphate deaminase [Propionibacterium sp.]
MEVIIVSTDAEVGHLAAEKIATLVARTPTAVIGLATGSSPEGIYRDLRARVEAGEISFAEARGFALDEYVGIPLNHRESYASVINREVVEPLGFNPSRVRVPDGRAEDLEFVAAKYDADIGAAGGVDIQILGIGTNGHIGFNEPTSSFASRTRIKTLAPRTRQDNQRFFNSLDEVPVHCITQGLGTILEARELLLVAQGEKKADAIAAAVEGPLTSFVPGSALQLHPHATVILDKAAASRLQLTDYYRHTYANKLNRIA